MSFYGTPSQNYGRPPYNQAQPQVGYNSGYGQQPPPQQQYGYNTPAPQYGRPPPPTSAQHAPQNADPQLWYWFQAVDTDRSGFLTVEELQRALINGDWSPFNYETCRMMVNMFDTDNSGTINFQEFAGLWRYIEEWRRIFSTFDADGSGTINFHELKNALRTFGYNLSDNFIGLLIKKYDKYGTQDVTFDSFVQACVTVKTLTDAFRRFDTDNDGKCWVQINYEQFLELVVMNR
ncbi:uncharacterized protein VTP21DRAFT_7171 [Calcarisporiella thermophila]|uniref:uncharacterized protein n=1 Tax=Calcarisporiella thermophila TaxID=911321 RepID=UPI0037448AE0